LIKISKVKGNHKMINNPEDKDRIWIPVDAYFLSQGFPLTHERTEKAMERLKKMGYKLKDPESFMEIHERIMARFYKGKDRVHTQKAWKKYKGKKYKGK